VKILAVSDNLLPQLQDPGYLQRSYSDARLVVSCGDMPASYLDVISSVLNLPLFFVRGNHDEHYEPHRPGGDNLHMKFQSYGGFSFVGLEGSIEYNRGRVQYDETGMLARVLYLLPRLVLMRSVRGYGVDVLVTHSPPRGIHDIPGDRAHRGFRAFRLLMLLAHPRFLIHGHVDTWDNRKTTETQYCRTRVININPVRLLSIERE
jgi:Icc-related predicted phosphoesterase